MSCRSVPEPGGRLLTDGTWVITRSRAQPRPPWEGPARRPALGKVGDLVGSRKLPVRWPAGWLVSGQAMVSPRSASLKLCLSPTALSLEGNWRPLRRSGRAGPSPGKVLTSRGRRIRSRTASAGPGARGGRAGDLPAAACPIPGRGAFRAWSAPVLGAGQTLPRAPHRGNWTPAM